MGLLTPQGRPDLCGIREPRERAALMGDEVEHIVREYTSLGGLTPQRGLCVRTELTFSREQPEGRWTSKLGRRDDSGQLQRGV